MTPGFENSVRYCTKIFTIKTNVPREIMEDILFFGNN